MKRSTPLSQILQRLEGSPVLEVREVASGLRRTLTRQELKRISGGQRSDCVGGTSDSGGGQDDSIDIPILDP
jgi:hypothetical protein